MGTFVEVKPLDYSAAGNELTTKTYHGLAIIVNGNTVGRISSFKRPALSRTITPVRELTPPGQAGGSFGRIVETVPGKSEDGSYTLTCNRTELWGKELELALGYEAKFLDLCDQDAPFILEEHLFKGDKQYEAYKYVGCWFTELGTDDFTVDGDAMVKVTSTIMFTGRHRIL